MTFLFPFKRSLNHPKKVTSRIARNVVLVFLVFITHVLSRFVHPFFLEIGASKIPESVTRGISSIEPNSLKRAPEMQDLFAQNHGGFESQ